MYSKKGSEDCIQSLTSYSRKFRVTKYDGSNSFNLYGF